MNRATANEIELFSSRILSVILGTLNSSMPDVAELGNEPIPDDYKDMAVGQVSSVVQWS